MNERWSTRDHVVQDGPERVKVRPEVHLIEVLDLFWRQVRGRPADDLVAEIGPGISPTHQRSWGGEPEIGDFQTTTRIKKQVTWLQITMYQSISMNLLQSGNCPPNQNSPRSDRLIG